MFVRVHRIGMVGEHRILARCHRVLGVAVEDGVTCLVCLESKKVPERMISVRVVHEGIDVDDETEHYLGCVETPDGLRMVFQVIQAGYYHMTMPMVSS